MKTRDKRKVGGPIPVQVATEPVLLPLMIEEAVGRVVLTVAGVVLCYWLTSRRK